MDKIERERRFHNKEFANKERSTANKFYSIAQSSRNYYINSIINNVYGSRVLEYGCGPGSSAFMLAKNGAKVTGIDISEYAIMVASETISFDSGNIGFFVMNAEDLTFSDNSFDLICGSGIIHHLELNKAFSELSRTLTVDGRAIFLEPLGHNLLINCYRQLTPHLRTPDEHPLLMSDILIAKKYFHSVEIKYFHLFSLLAVPFRNVLGFNSLLNLLDRFDRLLLDNVYFVRKFAWAAVLTLYNPIKFVK